MKDSLLLRKGYVFTLISKCVFVVKDVLTGQEIKTTVSGKMKMTYKDVNIGDEVYVIVSPHDTSMGRVANPSYFKLDNELFAQKLIIEQEHKKLK